MCVPERLKSGTPTPPHAGKNSEQQEVSLIAGGNAKRTATLEGRLVASWKTTHAATTTSSSHAPPSPHKGSHHANLHACVCGSFIHNGENLEATKTPLTG